MVKGSQHRFGAGCLVIIKNSGRFTRFARGIRFLFAQLRDALFDGVAPENRDQPKRHIAYHRDDGHPEERGCNGRHFRDQRGQDRECNDGQHHKQEEGQQTECFYVPHRYFFVGGKDMDQAKDCQDQPDGGQCIHDKARDQADGLQQFSRLFVQLIHIAAGVFQNLEQRAIASAYAFGPSGGIGLGTQHTCGRRFAAAVLIQKHLCRIGQACKGKFAVYRHQADRLVVNILDLGARILVDFHLQRFARKGIDCGQEGSFRFFRLLCVEQFDGFVKYCRIQVVVRDPLRQRDRFGNGQRDRCGQDLFPDLGDRFGHVAQCIVDQFAQAAAVGCEARLYEGGRGQRNAHFRLYVFQYESRDVCIVAEIRSFQHFLYKGFVYLYAQVQPGSEQHRQPRDERDHEDREVWPNQFFLQVGFRIAVRPVFRFHR